MTWRDHLVCLPGVGIGLCIALTALAADASPETTDVVCGQVLGKRDVLVLDLQHLAQTPELADEFVIEQAGDYRLANPLIEEFRLPFRPNTDPDRVTREAYKLGVKKGCDLVLILKTGPYLGKQRGRNIKTRDHGYALVATGQREYDVP